MKNQHFRCWSPLGPHLVPLGPYLVPFGPHLVPTWSRLGPICFHLVPFGPHLISCGPHLAPNWSPSGSHLVATWSPKESQRTRGPPQGSQKNAFPTDPTRIPQRNPRGYKRTRHGAQEPHKEFQRSPTGSLDLFFDMGLRTVAPTSFGGTLLESGAECHTESILCPCIVPIMYQGCRLSSTVRVLCWDNFLKKLQKPKNGYF